MRRIKCDLVQESHHFVGSRFNTGIKSPSALLQSQTSGSENSAGWNALSQFIKTKHSLVRIKRMLILSVLLTIQHWRERTNGKCIWFWGWWNGQSHLTSYILCFHAPSCECCLPHVALQLFQRRGLSVQRHLPAHIIYHGLDCLLQVIRPISRRSRDRNRTIQVGVIFSLQVINKFLIYLKKEHLNWDRITKQTNNLQLSLDWALWQIKVSYTLGLIWMLLKRHGLQLINLLYLSYIAKAEI